MNRRPPQPIAVASLLLAAIAASHVAVPVVMGMQSSALAREIGSAHPGFGPATRAAAVAAALRVASVFHAVFFILFAGLVWAVRSGVAWTRAAATGVCLLAIAAGFVSWAASPMFHALIVAVDAAQIAALVLLWVPAASRVFFAR